MLNLERQWIRMLMSHRVVSRKRKIFNLHKLFFSRLNSNLDCLWHIWMKYQSLASLDRLPFWSFNVMSHTKLLVIFLETKSPLKYIFSTYSPSWSKSVLQNVRDMVTVINKLQFSPLFNFPWYQRFFLVLFFSIFYRSVKNSITPTDAPYIKTEWAGYIFFSFT